MRRILVVAVLLVGLMGLGESPAAAKSRCKAVPDVATLAIAAGIQPPGDPLILVAKAVRSDDFARVFFVSAVLRGTAVTEGTIATWATNSLDGTGLVYSIDDVAKQISDWGHGDTTDAALTLDNDGAKPSRKCARKAGAKILG